MCMCGVIVCTIIKYLLDYYTWFLKTRILLYIVFAYKTRVIFSLSHVFRTNDIIGGLQHVVIINKTKRGGCKLKVEHYE